MKLIEALRYSDRATLAFVGAGGKTTAMFHLARELITTSSINTSYKTVLVSTSTHLGTDQISLADHFIEVSLKADVTQLEQDLPQGIVLLGGQLKNGRLSGLSMTLLEEVNILAEKKNLPFLIEADGSKQRPLKAPAQHEPVIPDFIQEVIVMAGLQGLGKPLTKEWVHRPEIFSKLSGIELGKEIPFSGIVEELLSKSGGLKNIPTSARRRVIFTQAFTDDRHADIRKNSLQVLREYDSLILARLWKDHEGAGVIGRKKELLTLGIQMVIEKVAGIVLAAGSSHRFGKPKQLLLWRGQPLVKHVINVAQEIGLSPVVVVVGSSVDEVEQVIKNENVRIVNNHHWLSGVSSSIRAGLNTLTENVGGAIFLQADQPQISPLIIKNLVEAHEQTLAPIVAPRINGQRGNPVLFDHKTFPDLLSLDGDIGGRALFSQYPVQWITWTDENMLLDIDTPEDYQEFLSLYPEEGEKK